MPRLEPDDPLHAELEAHPADIDRYYIQVDGGDQTSPVFGWYLVSHLNVLGPILAALRSLFIPASASAPASLDLHEDTDNGSSRVRITAPAALAANRIATLQDADGTVAYTGDLHAAVTLAGTPDYITLSGQVVTRGLVDLTTDVTGDLPVPDGGTGVSTLPSGQLLTGAGTSPVTGTAIPAGGLAGLTALGLKADAANPVFTGTVTVPDGALAIADTSGLQAALDAKEASAAAAPILVTSDLTLVAATHHRKMLEMNTTTSPRITCAAIGAGVRVRLHRPHNDKASPIILPAYTSGTALDGGSALGFNRIWAGGVAEIEYNNTGYPTVRGDLQWGGRPNSTGYASLADLVDLRRGEGLSTSVVGNPVSSWVSQGVASEDYTNGTAGVQPLLNADGTIMISTAASKKWLGGAKTAFAGTVLIVGLAWRAVSYTSGEPSMITLQQSSTNRLLFRFNSGTAGLRIRIESASGNTTTTLTFLAAQEWRAAVVALDRTNGKLSCFTNSRHATTTNQRLIASVTAAHFPDWTAWTLSGEGNSIGDVNGSGTAVYHIAGVTMFDNADAGVLSTEIDADFMLRVLGQMRSFFPPDADG